MRKVTTAVIAFAAAFTLWGIAKADISAPAAPQSISLQQSDARVWIDRAGTATVTNLASGDFRPARTFVPAVHATYLHPVVYWFAIPAAARWNGWIITTPRDVAAATSSRSFTAARSANISA